MRERFLQYIKEYKLFDRGDKVVVGVSGGRDSVCLLHLLGQIQPIYALELLVFHMNHGIRGQEAAEDAEFVREMAGRLGLPFFGVNRDIPNMAREQGMTEEEAGRHARYEAMEECRLAQAADKIAIAHHRDDQAETVLFHLFRGSGPRGLAGMPVRRGCIVRPLLFAGREDINRYVEDQKLSFREDGSNAQSAYSRNWIRREILPMVEERINTRAMLHIAQAAEQMAVWRDFIETTGRQAFDAHVRQGAEGIRLDIEGYRQEEKAVRGEILRCIFSRLIPGAKDISRYHYERIEELSVSATGRAVDLPSCCMAFREYGEIIFAKKADKKDLESEDAVTNKDGEEIWIECHPPCRHIVNWNGELFRIEMEIKKRSELPEEIPEKGFSKWFDYDKINDGLVIRNPGEGDYFILDSHGGRKKLARYYMDCKIPRGKRACQVVLAEKTHVLWAFPDRISAAFRVFDNTKYVLVVTKERIRS